jgi:hypothetical protein
MVVYILYLQADVLQGVASVAMNPDADLCLSVRNPLDHAETRAQIMVEPVLDDAHSSNSNNSRHAYQKGDVTAAAYHHHSNHSKTHVKHAEAPCHFALTWQGATQRSTIRVLEHESVDTTTAATKTSGKGKKKNHHGSSSSNHMATALTAKDSGTPVPLLRLECDGIEPYAFHLTGRELIITNTAGVVFGATDELTWSATGDWSAYDMGSGTTRIANLQGSFE